MSSNHPLVMLVADDAAARNQIEAMLRRGGYRTAAMPQDDAIQTARGDNPACVVLDLGGEDAHGLDVLASIKRDAPNLPVILVSRDPHTATVVQAIRLGATDFLCEPLVEQSLLDLIDSALRQQRLRAELAPLRLQVEAEPKYRLLDGRSPLMLDVRRLIERVADTDATVLVRGESGTGKELVARAIHGRSSRAARPFVKVNCAALPGELLESELFGYERGAFTGAAQQKPGRFEFANHGTMFLDEIGDMGLPLQAKLLQVLQDGEFSRVGGSRKSDVRVDVRIVAATNRDLDRAVADGLFREDLFFRLDVVTVTLPPLRDRREDVPIFLEHFIRKYSVHYNKPQPAIAGETLRLFSEYDWPGNIRELENAVKRIVVLGTDVPVARELQRALAAAPSAARLAARPSISPGAGVPPQATASAEGSDAAANDTLASGPVGSLKEIARAAARAAESVAISKMLQRTRWNRKAAAEILGISYKALLYKIKENGLDKTPSTT